MGCLEGLVNVIRRALHLGILLRHEKTGVSGPELKALLSLHECVSKNLIGEKKQIIKFIYSLVD